MGDDARIDDELLFVSAINDIHEMHIRLLSRMVAEIVPGPGWNAQKIAAADPGLADVVLALLGTLELYGLIGVVPGVFVRGENAGQTLLQHHQLRPEVPRPARRRPRLRTPDKSGALRRWQPGLLHTLTAVNMAGCCTLSTHCRRAMF